MNSLVVGFDTSPILDRIPSHNFLLIDDGPVADSVSVRAKRFDPALHSFNPLKDMSYTKARDFITLLNATFPEGESTLTRRTSNYQLLKALLDRPKSLATLIPRTKDTLDAFQKIDTLLSSPVLEPVLTKPTNLSFRGTLIARLDRAELGDFDCFVLGNLLISQFKGTVVVPDFGFYACPFHVALIRQKRLVAGIRSFDEIKSLRNDLVAIEDKVGSHCTPEDAEILARYAGIAPHTIGYQDFIERCIKPA